jgi:RNA polymerase sigma-70 factor (ECF subfamily)
MTSGEQLSGCESVPLVPGPSSAGRVGTNGSTSRSLLVRLRADEADAWERLVKLYAPLVYHWCRKLGLAERDAADVLQDVFQAVAANIAGFHRDRPGDTFRGWLRTIARHKVYDHFRRQGREPAAAGGTAAFHRLAQFPAETTDDDGELPADDDADRRLFRRALELIRSEFTERTWQAFWLVAVEGRSPADAGAELSMRPGAVRVAKSRVLHRLRQELGDRPE